SRVCITIQSCKVNSAAASHEPAGLGGRMCLARRRLCPRALDMTPSLLHHLVCPACSGPLSAEPFASHDHEIQESALTCSRCRVYSPIHAFVPVLLVFPTPFHAEFARPGTPAGWRAWASRRPIVWPIYWRTNVPAGGRAN